MPDATFLSWPFFDDAHRALVPELDAWCEREIAPLEGWEDEALDATCREIVHRLGQGGWLRYAVPRGAEQGGTGRLDVRALCLIRETLGRHSGIADFAFALQGLGSGPLSLFGSEEQRRTWLPRVAAGRAISAFALSEAESGSDVSSMTTTARRDGDGWVIDGEKTWISNAGLADFYVVFCRLPDEGEKAFAALLVEADNPGLQVTRRIDVLAPHPLGTISFEGCRVPASALVGEPGKGLKVALGTLDVFRSTVGAAALGFARRALDEAVAHATRRKAFGKPLAEFQLTQAKIADMATAVDASALLVYRAAWTRDT
jgi:acyl-CoA dehydrogenase